MKLTKLEKVIIKEGVSREVKRMDLSLIGERNFEMGHGKIDLANQYAAELRSKILELLDGGSLVMKIECEKDFCNEEITVPKDIEIVDGMYAITVCCNKCKTRYINYIEAGDFQPRDGKVN